MRSHAVALDPTTRAERLLRLAAEVPGGVAALLAELRADLMAANAMVDNPDDHAVDGAVTNVSSKGLSSFWVPLVLLMDREWFFSHVGISGQVQFLLEHSPPPSEEGWNQRKRLSPK